MQLPVTTGPTLVGSAIVAFKSLGRYEGLETASKNMVKAGDVFKLDPVAANVYQENYQFFLKSVETNRRLYQEHHKMF